MFWLIGEVKLNILATLEVVVSDDYTYLIYSDSATKHSSE